MTKTNIGFGLKSQESYLKIREGELVGIAIQTWDNYIWSSCGYLMLPNDPAAIQFLEKKRLSQEHFFWLQTEAEKIRVEEFKENTIFSEDGKEIKPITKKKVYVEDPNWGQNIKFLYCKSMKYFMPQKVIRNENNLLHIEIEPMNFYEKGPIDKLIFTGEKINQYRDLIVGNLGKEFEIELPIFADPKLPIDTNQWNEAYKHKVRLAEDCNKPEKSASELKKIITEYYREKDIKMMKLSAEDKEFLDIVFNNGKNRRSDTFSDSRDRQKFEQVKIYLKSNNKEKLTYSELSGSSNTNSSHNFNKENKNVTSSETIVLTIVVMILALGFFSWLIWRGKRTDTAPTTVRIRKRG